MPSASAALPQDRTPQGSSPAPVPSGLNWVSLTGPAVRPALPLSRWYQEFVAHTRERRGNTLERISTARPSPPLPIPPRVSPAPLLQTTSPVVHSQELIIRDTAMELGGGSNTPCTGLGDCYNNLVKASGRQFLCNDPTNR